MTIDMRDFVRRVLLKWRVLVICMLVACVVLTVIGGIQSFSAAKEAQAALEAQQAAGGPGEGQAWVVVPAVVWVNPVQMVLGLLLGAVAVAADEFVKYVFSPKLRVVDDLSEVFGVPVLGELTLALGGKEKNKIDGLINKLFEDNKSHLTNEQQNMMACAEIRLITQKNNYKNIYLIGATSNKHMDKLKASFAEKLKNNVPGVRWGQSPVADPANLEQLAMADAVVLFERVDDSDYWAIQKELEYCRRYNTAVIGCVVVK